MIHLNIMYRIVFLLLFSTLLNAVEHKSNISLKYLSYKDYKDEVMLVGETQFKLQNEFLEAELSLEYLYSSEYDERRYLIINELFLSKDYEDYSFSFGKIIKYWGEMEGFNLSDVYNQKNYLLDPFDKSAKLGSLGVNITRYFDEDSLEFGVKFYEQDLEYPKQGTPYYPFPLKYDNGLKYSDERYTPTFHLMYNFVTDENFESETKIILLHGYDNKRYFIQNSPTTLSQYAYRVNKLIALSNLIYQDIIFKYEASYTDIVDDKMMSNYTQLSFGMEKNFYDILGVDIGSYAEYYSYIYMQDNKIKNVDISEIYNDDIFLALKIDFSDVRSSEIKGGVLYDLKNAESIFKLEASSRIWSNLVLNAEFLQIVAKQKTLLSNIGDSKRAILGLTYAF